MKRRLLAGLLVAGAVALAAPWLPVAPISANAPDTPRATQPESAKAESRFAALPTRAPIGELRGGLFAPPPAPPPPVVAAAQAQAPAKPVPPPVLYRVAGTVTHDGVAKVVLAKGDAVLTVEEGETLEGGYRVESIGASEITLLYVPLGVRERLPVIVTLGVDEPAASAVAAPASRPAQARWEGPERVPAVAAENLSGPHVNGQLGVETQLQRRGAQRARRRSPAE